MNEVKIFYQRKSVLEKYSFKILQLESVSESCTFFTHIKLPFHHHRYLTNNSSDTKSFFMITPFYCLAEPSFPLFIKIMM